MKELKEFEVWFEQVKNDKIEQISFVFEIMKSPYVEYHYSLIKDKRLSEGFRRNLIDRFDEHQEKGQLFLLSKLDNNEDVFLHPEIIYMLGKLNDGKNRPDKNKVVAYARQLLLSPDDYTRDRAIIVLGWIGSNSELPLLVNCLLHDTNSKCRAWASSSFMQMNFRLKRMGQHIDEQIIFPALQKAITSETDYFALGTYIISLQEIITKKWLSGIAAERINVQKIEIAKKSAINFLKKWEQK